MDNQLSVFPNIDTLFDDIPATKAPKRPPLPDLSTAFADIQAPQTPEPDPFGMAPGISPAALATGLGAGFVDLSMALPKMIAGGLGEAINLPGNLQTDPSKVGKFYEKTMQAFPIPWEQLLTPEGEAVRQATGLPFAIPGMVGDAITPTILEHAGPEAAAAVQTALEISPIAGMVLGAGRSLVRGAKAGATAVGEALPEGVLFRSKAGRSWTAQEVGDILRATDETTVDPDLLASFKDLTPAEKAEAVKGAGIDITTIEPTWLGKLLGKEGKAEAGPGKKKGKPKEPPAEAVTGEPKPLPEPPAPAPTGAEAPPPIEGPPPGAKTTTSTFGSEIAARTAADAYQRNGFDTRVVEEGGKWKVDRWKAERKVEPPPLETAFEDVAPVAPTGPTEPATVPPTEQTKPAGQPFVERRKVPQEGPRERRKDLEQRKKIAEMSPEEKEKALRYDELTGLQSRRAYEEAEHRPITVAMDVHGQKWANDNLGHDVGDRMLQAVADAIHEGHGEGYRISGDEFAFDVDTPDEAEHSVRKIKEFLQDATLEATLPDGTKKTFKGITISHGTGGSIDEAFTALNADKEAAIARGERSAERGGRPGKLAEITPGRIEDKDREPAALSEEQIADLESPEMDYSLREWLKDKGKTGRYVEVEDLAKGLELSQEEAFHLWKKAVQEKLIDPEPPGFDDTREDEGPPEPEVKSEEENVPGVPSGIRKGKAPVEAEPDERRGRPEVGTGGVLQKPGEAPAERPAGEKAAGGEAGKQEKVASDTLRPSDPVPELAKGERVTKGNVTAWVEQVEIRGKPAWVAKHKTEGSDIVLTEGGVGFGLWTKGQAIERAARNLREAREKTSEPEEKPEPVVAPAPESLPPRPPSERWTADPGAIPGEPSMFLDGETAEDAKATLVERISEQGTSSWDAYDKDGVPIVHNKPLEEAARLAEDRIERDEKKPPVPAEISREPKPPVTQEVIPPEFALKPPGKREKIEEKEGPALEPVAETVRGKPTTRPAEDVSAVEGERPVDRVPELGERTGEGTELPTVPAGDESVPSGERGGEELPAPERERPTEPRGEPARKPNARSGVDLPSDTLKAVLQDALKGGEKTRARQNLEAIRTLKKLESEERLATPEEQKILAKYVGWGGISKIFEGRYAWKEGQKEWGPLYQELAGLLTEEELDAAQASTINAHYTDVDTIKAMWGAVQGMGFNGGRILEPAAGIGHFLGIMPKEIRENSRVSAIELDQISGKIASQLYQTADVRVESLQESKIANNYYDLAISNVPFSDTKILEDRAYRKYRFSLHNYFFAKSLDKVRPGGLIAFITTHYTLDAVDPYFRDYMAERSDLIGALRLPKTAFKKNAGTEVVTDILFLRKKVPGEESPVPKVAWKETRKMELGIDRWGGDVEKEINEYFHDHPTHVLGTHSHEGSMYGQDEYTVDPVPEAESGAALGDWITTIARGRFPEVYTKEIHEATESPDLNLNVPAPEDIKEGAFYYDETERKLYRNERGTGIPITAEGKTLERIKGMIQVRDLLRRLHRAQLMDAPEDEIEVHRRELNQIYDRFVKGYGILHARENFRLFEEDPDAPLILSLEIYDPDTEVATKADIFSKRTVFPYKRIEKADTANEALFISLNEYGRVDFGRMKELTGKSEGEIIQELAGMIYMTPEGKWETADEYLSGNVRAKLEDARGAAKNDPAFQANVDALEQVIPEDIPFTKIDVRLGSSWVSVEDVKAFVMHLLGAYEREVRIRHSESQGSWSITVDGYRRNTVLGTSTWGTNDMDAVDLIDDALNMRTPVVKRKDDEGKVYTDQNATIAARQKMQDVKDEFKKWIWTDVERRNRLHRHYNDNFNAVRLRTYDGSHLTLPGQASGIELRPHQKNATWRAITSGNTLFGHVVGSGKTFAMIATAMEKRRLGLSKKSLIAEPKHLIRQVAGEFLRLYPSANVLVAGEDDFTAEKRQKFISRIATGDWDAVIITHEHFKAIPVSPELQEEIIRGEMRILEEEIALAEEEDRQEYGRRRKKSKTVKQLEKAKEKLEQKLKALADAKRDENVMYFEELGIDQIFVDEAHKYKNLFFPTKMRNIAGLGSQNAERAFDMYMKTFHINRITDHRGVIFSTGTPITNTMAEIFNMQRYLQPQTLADLGVSHFDSWAQTFGDIVTGLEVSVSGKYQVKSRFAKFTNLPELLGAFRSVADIQTKQMLNLPTPAMKTGNRITERSLSSKEYIAFVKHLGDRADRIRSGSVNPREDNMLKVTTDGRDAALDMRRISVVDFSEDPNGKINKVVENVYRIWKEGNKEKHTQLIFCDRGTPTSKVPNKLNVYSELKNKLVGMGIPKGEIAYIHDAKTDDAKIALFRNINRGRVRVLIGSTSKMGEGMNAQRLLKALHHLDVPWTPGLLEQREGRILRQGNTNEEVEIRAYVTQGSLTELSFDAYMWQTLETKQKFVEQVMQGDPTIREAEDLESGSLSFAEIKSFATGNPIIMEKTRIERDLRELRALASKHLENRAKLESDLASYPTKIESQKAQVAAIRSDIETVKRNRKEEFEIVLDGTTYTEREAAGKKIREEAAKLPEKKDQKDKTKAEQTKGIGTFLGLDVQVVKFTTFDYEADKKEYKKNVRLTVKLVGEQGWNHNVSDSDLGTISSLAYTVDRRMEHDLDMNQKMLEQSERNYSDAQKEFAKKFDKKERLDSLEKRLVEIDRELEKGKDTGEDLGEGGSAEVEEGVSEKEPEEEEPEKKTGEEGPTLYASPLDPELIRQSWKSLSASIQELQDARKLAKKAKRTDLNWFNNAVNTPYYIFGEKFPQFRPVFDRMREMMQERDDIASEMAIRGTPYFSTLELNEKTPLNKILIRGRYERTVYTREELEEKGLDEAQIEAYFAVRDMLDHALDVYEDGIIYRVTKGQIQSSSNIDMEIIRDVLKELKFPETRAEGIIEILEKIRTAKRQGYVPFARFGDFGFGLRHIKEDGSPGEYYYWATEDTAHKAAKAYLALTKRFHKGISEGRLLPIPPKEMKKKEEKDLLSGIGGFELEILSRLMSLEESTRDDLKEAVEQLFQETGFRKHFFESKDTPGFSTDMERALADYIVGLSGFVSRIKGLPEMDALAKGMVRFPKLAQYYREWRDYTISPHEEYHRLRSGLFLYFLGGNPKSAAINMTQMMTATIPWLSQYVSQTRAIAEVTRAIKTISTALGKREDGSYGVVVEKLPRDVREIVNRGYREGIISEQLIYELMGVAHKPSKLRKISKQKQRVVRGFGFLFSMAEKVNRLVTMVAAARIHASLMQKATAGGGGKGGEPPKKPPTPGVPFEDDPFEFSKRASDETQFIYAKFNRPRMFRNFGAIFGVFRTFVINYMELLARFWRRGSIRAVLSVFVMLWFLAGVKGMPFAENIKYLLEQIVGAFTHRTPDLETAVREWGYNNLGGPEVMDYFLSGPSRRITGIDIGRSVGTGDIVPLLGDDWEDPLAGIIGAPAEVFVKRPMRAYDLAREGQYSRAAEAVAPEFLRNPLYAARILREGLLDRAGGQIVRKEDLSPADIAKKALGFMPTKVSKAYEREEAKYRIGERTEKVRREITREILNLVRQGKGQDAIHVLETQAHGYRPKDNRDNIVFTGKTLPKSTADWIILDEQYLEKAAGETKLGPEWRGILRQPILQRQEFLKMNKLYQ